MQGLLRHLETCDSTNRIAREWAREGAPDGSAVVADHQSAGRGRLGRTWVAEAGDALLLSVVVRPVPQALTLVAGVAVADALELLGGGALAGRVTVKWPNDVLLDGRKVAGVLGETRPQEGWCVLGIGLNVAVRVQDLPGELHDRAASLGLEPAAIEPTLDALLRALEHRLGQATAGALDDLRARDALRGRRVRWAEGDGVACGIDDEGRLLVQDAGGGVAVALTAGEVHLLAGE